MIFGNKTCVVKYILSRFFSRAVNEVRLANMDTAYFRYVQGSENYDLSFIFNEPELKIERQFNFSRRSTETVGSLISRININVENVLRKKKIKKKRKNTDTENEQTEQLNSKLLQDGEQISENVVCIEVLQEKKHTELHILNKVFKIEVNSPWIVSMLLPSSILAGFPVYPLKFEGLFLKKEKSQFQWFVQINKKHITTDEDWECVGEGFTYYPKSSDIGKRIKLNCIPGNDENFGPKMETVSPSEVQAGPGFCPFETRHLFTKEKLLNNKLRVVSYNILADLYCDSDFTRTQLFPYCPPYALHIDYRKQLFIKEIAGYNGDIVCLQEVDSKIFDNDLLPVLRAQNYDGIFLRKGGLVVEGLACFYQNKRFKLIKEKSCVLSEQLESPIFKDIWSLIKDNEPFVNRLKPRTTALQAIVLQSLENERELIVVGNTHLYFKPDSDHIRVMQGGLTILWLCDIIETLKNNFPEKRVSLILCGDFNSVPTCGVYQLYTKGYVPSDYIDWRSNESEAVTNVSLRQPLPLESACGTPEFTNFTAGFADCLDYIFYQRDCFDVIQVPPLPSVEELSQYTAIPSIVSPSDHVALVADLQFK